MRDSPLPIRIVSGRPSPARAASENSTRSNAQLSLRLADILEIQLREIERGDDKEAFPFHFVPSVSKFLTSLSHHSGCFDVALQEQLVDAMSPRRDDDTPATTGGRLVDLPLQQRGDIRRQRRRRDDDERP